MKGKMKKSWIAILLVVTSICVMGATGCKRKKPTDETSSSQSESVEHLHVWGEGDTSKVVCGVESEVIYTCTTCGETKSEFVFKEHEEEVTVVNATCQAKGYTLHECKNCGNSYRDAFTDILVHDYESETVAGTCTTNAKIVYACKNCTYFYEEVTQAAVGHNTSGCVWVDAGETQKDGCVYEKKQETSCVTCGETVTRSNDVEKHTYEFMGNNLSATCVAEGEMRYVCSECGAETTEKYSNAEAHDWQKTQTDSSTGITSYVCKHDSTHTKTMFSAKDKVTANITADVLKEVNEIELKEAVIKMDDEVRKQLGSDEISLSADTLDDAAKNTALENMTAEEKAKIGDKPIYDFTLQNQTGLVSTFNGKMTITIPYTLAEGEDPANIGVWYINNEGKTESIPAQYDNGFATFETSHFSYYTVVRLTPEERCALYGHSFWMPKTIAPTCTEEGYTMQSCKRCAIIENTDVVKALGHTYEGVAVEATCAEKGYTQYTCKTCNDSYSADYTEAGMHDYQTTVVAPTCEEKGYTQYTCSVCEDSYNDNYVDAIGHSYLNDVKAPTCTETGHEQRVCENCGKTHINSDFGEALGHDYKKTVVQPSCDKEGYTLHTCSRCDDSYKTDEQPALKHDYELTSGTEGVDAEYTCKNCGDVYRESAEEEHNLQVRYELVEGAKTCEDGVVKVEYCTECEYKKSDIIAVLGHVMFTEEIAKEDTACGETVLYKSSCACGQEVSVGVSHNSDRTGGHFSIHHEDGREGTRIIWECNNCDLTYWEDRYDQKVDCLNTRQTILHFGKTADGFKYSITAIKTYESHNTKTSEQQLEDGFVEYKTVCKDCGTITSHYKEKLDEYGRCLEYHNFLNNSSQKYEYDVCNRTRYRLDDNGEWIATGSSVYHKRVWHYELMDGATTCMDGVYDIYACVVCGEESNRSEEYPDGHVGRSVAIPIYTECGGFEIRDYKCACGQGDHYWVNNNNNCDFNRVNRVQLDNENDEKQSHYLETYECASCGYRYTEEYYYTRKDCKGTNYRIYKIDGKTYEREETYEAHNTRTESGLSTTEGATWYQEVCIDCGKMTDFYEQIKDEFNRRIYYKDFLENTSYTRVYREDCWYTQTNYKGDTLSNTVDGQSHGRTETIYTLKEGSITCLDGVIGTDFCVACNAQLGSWEVYGHERNKIVEKTIEAGAVCGEITVCRYICPCGEYVGLLQLEGNCDFDHTYNWIGKDGDKKEYEIRTYRCAVNACAYTIKEDRYYIVEGCNQHWYYIYRFDVKEDGSYAEEWTFDAVILAHDSEYTYEYENGIETETGVCINCGMITRVRQWDEYNREIYDMNYVKQSGEKRIYNGCQYALHTYKRSTGEFVYEGTYTHHATVANGGSCTQYIDGICRVCGFIIENEFYPWRHSYHYDSEKGTYVCYHCGMENPNGADGSFLMEDMSDENGIKVGIFQRWHNRDLGNVYIVADYDSANPVHLDGVEYSVEKTGGDYYDRSGIITVDMVSLQAELQNKGVTPTTISVVIEAYDDESGTYLDYILTFETW